MRRKEENPRGGRPPKCWCKGSTRLTLGRTVHLLIANAANKGLILRQVDIKTAFLQARMERDDPDAYLIPPKGLECQEKQKSRIWRLKAWLYGFRLFPRGWRATMHTYLLEIGFPPSTADSCVYNLDSGAVLLLSMLTNFCSPVQTTSKFYK